MARDVLFINNTCSKHKVKLMDTLKGKKCAMCIGEEMAKKASKRLKLHLDG